MFKKPRTCQVKEDEMGTACSTNGEKRDAYRILVGCQKERDHWEDQNVGGWPILKWILREIG
jgi:hypothetical protein